MTTTTTPSRRAGLAPNERGDHSLAEFVRSTGLSSLIVAASKDPNAKITVLLVSETGEPIFAVKAPTTDLAARAVRVERRALLEITAKLPERLRSTVPTVIDVVEFEGRVAVVVSALSGTPMTTTYYGWRHTASPMHVGGDFAAVETWLAALQRETSQDRKKIDFDGGVSALLETRFGDDDGIDADLANLDEMLDRLGRDTTPRTVVHGDFWFGNVLVQGEQVSGVVDWECGAASGEPLRDLVRFANMYALYLDRNTRRGRRVGGHPGLVAGGFGSGLEFALSGSGWFPDLYRHFLRHGLERLGASPEHWRDAALVGIAEVAARTDDHAFAQRHLELFRRISRVRKLGAARGGLRT